VREATGWGDTQLKIHLGRLTDLQYLLLHRKGFLTPSLKAMASTSTSLQGV
jgi:hypothetical protein